MGSLIEQQAQDFANVPIIQREIIASVHLEDWEDVLFWDTLLQRLRPGRYNYLAHSKADNGQKASGSSQCMKYVGYTSNRFFVCVDSDMNYLMQDPVMDASRFVAQTYTYSWENHYAMAEALQERLTRVAPQVGFDFCGFLHAYSSIVYHPLLALLHSLKTKDGKISRHNFYSCLPHQCRSSELANGGRVLLQKMANDLAVVMQNAADVDIEREAVRYEALGLTEENAYLHVRGHNLYDLLKSMGHQLCSTHQVDFENAVLNAVLPNERRYWQLGRVYDDLSQILQS